MTNLGRKDIVGRYIPIVKTFGTFFLKVCSRIKMLWIQTKDAASISVWLDIYICVASAISMMVMEAPVCLRKGYGIHRGDTVSSNMWVLHRGI